MRIDFVLKRFVLFLVLIWVAATLNFIGPRLTGKDPIKTRLLKQAAVGGYVQQGMDEMAKEYDRKFGLDQPLWNQYLTYLADMSRLNFGPSIANYPRSVDEIMAEALPWTIVLLGTTTLIAFALGSFLGAILAWPRSPRFFKYLLPPLLTLSAIPYYLLGLVLLYLLAFRLGVFPAFGGYTPGMVPQWSFGFVADAAGHAILPALSIILAAIGFWALGMRAMMVTMEGEDSMVFGEAKGLKDRTLFMRYGIRNAILPQATALALALGETLSGAVLVEVVFGYPGIGTVLFTAIKDFDYYLIQGIVFIIVVSIGFATLVIDLIYPLLDPRIHYRKA
ncbi:MAG: ABC transporter permease [Chloroflexi bacterium]|nr:ABC transporter permease [Chloroflexota bacterium]